MILIFQHNNLIMSNNIRHYHRDSIHISSRAVTLYFVNSVPPSLIRPKLIVRIVELDDEIICSELEVIMDGQNNNKCICRYEGLNVYEKIEAVIPAVDDFNNDYGSVWMYV